MCFLLLVNNIRKINYYYIKTSSLLHLHDFHIFLPDQPGVQWTSFQDLLHRHAHDSDDKGCADDQISMLGLHHKPTGYKLLIAHANTILQVYVARVELFVIVYFWNRLLRQYLRNPNIRILGVSIVFANVFCE